MVSDEIRPVKVSYVARRLKMLATPHITTQSGRPSPRSFVVPIVKPIPTPSQGRGSDDPRVW